MVRGEKLPFTQLNNLAPRVILDLWIVCDDTSSPADEKAHSADQQYSVKKRAKEMARHQGAEKIRRYLFEETNQKRNKERRKV